MPSSFVPPTQQSNTIEALELQHDAAWERFTTAEELFLNAANRTPEIVREYTETANALNAVRQQIAAQKAESALAVLNALRGVL